jgi:hypothetical protein
MELAAGAIGVHLQLLDLLDPKDIETAFQAAGKERAGGILVLASPVLAAHRTQIVDLAVKRRLPAIYWRSDFVEAGGLCPTARARTTWTSAPPRMWIRF